MKHLSILGSTGSVGSNALDIVEKFPERFTIKALAAAHNVELLARQIKKFCPDIAVVLNERRAIELKKNLPAGTSVEIMHGEDGYKAAATHSSVGMVLVAIVGAAGLMPTLAAINAGKDLALANKESIVMAGEIVSRMAAQKNVKILPIDSEHSAIFQCIVGHRREDVDTILLTASGGPFLRKPEKEFSKITPEDALEHPIWRMGKKISVDSATLMNKGLEVIEAKFLFRVSEDMIKVLIHPQSVIHSMVSYRDGAVIGQLGIPDMKGAIAYSISYPERLPLDQPMPDFFNIESLTFEQPDSKKFPCLNLAYKACKTGGTMPVVLNASNEVAVESFLMRRTSFVKIPEIISKTMYKHSVVKNPLLSDIIEADRWARETACQLL